MILAAIVFLLSGAPPTPAAIGAGERAVYSVIVPPRTAYGIRVEQKSVDVRASFSAPGATEPEDSANWSSGTVGREELLLPINDVQTEWHVVIEPVLPRALRGEYAIAAESQPADDAARARWNARVRFRDAARLHRTSEGKAIANAVTMYEEIARSTGDAFLRAESLYQAALAHDLLGDSAKAIERLREALQVFEELGLDGRRGRILDRLADLARKTGEVDEAEETFAAALPVLRAVRDPEGEADVLNNSGLLLTATGRFDEAITRLQEGIPLAHEVGSDDVEAALHHNLGQAFSRVGDYTQSLASYDRSLALKRRMGSPRRMATTQNNLATIYFTLGERERAIRTMLETLELWERAGDRSGTGNSLGALGRMYHATGDPVRALDAFQRAFPLVQQSRNRAAESTLLASWAQLELDTGDASAALTRIGEAVRLSRETRDRRGEARALRIEALIYEKLGRIDEAIASISAAVDVIESMREAISRQEFRSSYLATVREYYDLYIDLLLQRPDGVDDAFTVSERSRARTLLESLAESAAKIRKGIDPALQKRERAIQTQLNAKEAYRAQLQRANRDLAAIDREVDALLARRRDVEAEIRVASPQYASLKMPEAVSMQAVQRNLIDSDSLLIEYHAGARSTYAWVVGPQSATVHKLASQSTIDALARRYHALLSRDRTSMPAAEREKIGKQVAAAGRRLADAVLPPLARSRGKRLLIVADAALQYVPFAALPLPGSGAPLITRHEIGYLPSASVLLTMRNARPPKRSARTVAVFADPVFSRSDPRLPSPSRDAQEADYPRLRFSRREADAIKQPALKALDFQAAKSTLLATDLRRFDMLHFATHGTLDTARPELSGLVLSLFDDRGRSVDGFLRLHEIYNLDLQASLVVMSACKTALGKEVHGEGLIGLTRGFLYAGAQRVVSSIWNVDDRATAVLMARFYDEMLAKGTTPAAALRKAQLSMLQEARWSDPHEWAAFAVHGEWR